MLDFLGEFQFDGWIAETRISSVARYDADFIPTKRFEPDSHTLALYHFDEGLGDVLKDSSGNDHHGKIVGAKWVRVGSSSVPETGPVTDSTAVHAYALQFDGSGSLPIEGLVVQSDEEVTV